MAKLSGIQRDVLSLYRRSIRIAQRKDENFRPQFYTFARQEFEKYRDLPRKDIATIEFLLRAGGKKVDMFSNPHIRKMY